jgi:putative FmdB family regulatory protein
VPIFAFECNEHGVYDGLVGMTTEDATTCPKCGKHGARQFTPTKSLQMGETCIDPDRLPDGERQFILNNKKYIEDNAHKIRTGEMSVTEKGPSWARPKVEKRFH